MEGLLLILHFLVLSAVLYKWNFFSDIPFSLRIGLLTLKTLIGIGGGFIFVHYFKGGDTFAFMHDAQIFFSALKTSSSDYFHLLTGTGDPATLKHYYDSLYINREAGYGQWFNNSMLFVRFNAFLCLFTRGYYSIHILLMSFLSLIGLTALYKVIFTADGKTSKWRLLVLCLLPGTLFWGSMLLKEALVIHFLGLAIYYFYRYTNTSNAKHAVGFVLSFACLFVFKTYLALALMPGITAWFIFSRTGYSWIKVFTVTFICFFLLAVVAAQIDSRADLFLALHNQQIVFMKFGVYFSANSLIDLIPFSPDPVSVLKRSPEALWTALMRPYPGEANSLFQSLAVAENGIIILLLVFLLFKISWKSLLTNPVQLTLISAGIIILVITAFTTPVLGALVRLKMPGILLLAAGLLGSYGTKTDMLD